MNGDLGRAIRLQIGDYADMTGIDVNALHHETGRMQHEIALSPAPILKAADDFVTIKHLTKNAAMLVGAVASFAPKYSNNEPMNSVHVNVSGWKNDENGFLDMSGEPLSKQGYYFLAGIADHSRALSAFLLPSTLSYKELVQVETMKVMNGIVRIPRAIKGEADKRIEYRLSDPSINPYLAYAAIVAAGVDGITKKLTFEEGKEIAPPRSLAESLSALLSDSDFFSGVFGDEIVHTYVELKEREIKEVSSKMTGFEMAKYLNI
jgi:glutamine synthetase